MMETRWMMMMPEVKTLAVLIDVNTDVDDHCFCMYPIMHLSSAVHTARASPLLAASRQNGRASRSMQVVRAAKTADGPKVAIVGVTGAVGQEFLRVRVHVVVVTSAVVA